MEEEKHVTVCLICFKNAKEAYISSCLLLFFALLNFHVNMEKNIFTLMSGNEKKFFII